MFCHLYIGSSAYAQSCLVAHPAQHGSGTGSTGCPGMVGPVLLPGYRLPSCSVSQARAGKGGLGPG